MKIFEIFENKDDEILALKKRLAKYEHDPHDVPSDFQMVYHLRTVSERGVEKTVKKGTDSDELITYAKEHLQGQFWKVLSLVGKDRLIASSKGGWDDLSSHPIRKSDMYTYRGKERSKRTTTSKQARLNAIQNKMGQYEGNK